MSSNNYKHTPPSTERVPKLRFPEFTNENTWVEKKLSEVLFEHGERSTGVEEVFSVSVHKGVVNQIEHLGRSFSAANTENYKRVLPGDIIYTKSPTGDFPFGIIKQSKVTKPVIVSPLYGVFKPETIALGVILDAYFEYPGNAFNYLVSIIQKGAKNTININNETFLSKSLILPIDKTEQQKIADCLSSLDDFITAENQKLVELKAHKKGLMQNLFPAEGETVPKLRFKEFENSGDWKENTLGDCLLNTPEYGINAAAVPYSDKLPTYLRITDISEDGIFLTNNKVSVDKNVTETNYLTEGDIVLARTGASVGKSYKYRVKDGKFVFAGFLIRIKPDENKLNSEFIFQFLSTPQYWKWVSFISARSGQPGINGTEYSSMLIYLPPIIDEQQKIAACLSSLDELITAQSQRIDALKEHKKGLMQGLFPNFEGVNE